MALSNKLLDNKALTIGFGVKLAMRPALLRHIRLIVCPAIIAAS